MPFNPELHHRRSVRLKDYDYAQNGAYFVTICGHLRRPIFGHIDRDGVMHANAWGKVVWEEWERTAINRPYVELDAFVVMPNHVHGIIVIIDQADTSGAGVGAQRAAPLPPGGATPNNVTSGSLGAIVRGFKSAATRRINTLRDMPGAPVWLRSFHDVIIRNQPMLDQLRRYTIHNPSLWAEDRYYAD